MSYPLSTPATRPPAGPTVHRDFPSPTEAFGGRRLWLWSLPGRAITVLSILAFVVTTLVLASTPRLRALFRLPVAAVWVALGAAVVSGVVAWVARRRPGRLLPRAWALLLAGLSAAVAALAQQPRFGEVPLVHVLAAGVAVAAAVLAFRLARPTPTGPWLEWIVLLASSFTLLVLSAGLPLAARAAQRSWQRDIDAALGELELVSRSAARAAEEAEGPDAFLDAIAACRPGRWLQQDRLWTAARELGRDRELAAAGEGVVQAVAASLSPERAPTLARLAWPAIWYDRERQAWVEDPRFAAASRSVSRYYRQLGALLLALRPPTGAAAASASPGFAAAYDDESKRWRARLVEMSTSWSDGWVVAQVARGQEAPHGQAPAPAGAPTLAELLEQPVFRTRAHALRVVELWALMGVPGADAWSMGAQPGCLRHRYAEDEVAILRADCFAYAARAEGDGAELLIEARLVYRDQTAAVDFERALPHEVYLLFPVPSGRSADEYRVAVTALFSRAVDAAHGGRQRLEADRSGTSVNGFRLVDRQRSLRVRSRTIPYLEGRQAVELRAFWE